jgi:membrane-associated phospholipid phosphatase
VTGPGPGPKAVDGRRDAIRAAAVLVSGWVLLVAVVVAVGLALTGPLEGSVDPGDNRLERGFAADRTGPLTHVADVVTLLGETVTVLVLGAVLLVGTWFWRHQIRPVAFVAAALLGEIAAYLVTVSLVSRDRPPVRILDPGLDPTHSYPSGHVAASVALYGALAVLIWRTGRSGWRWLCVPLVAVPPLVGLARLYLGAHHLSDVITSLVFMSVWLAFAAAVLLRGKPAPREQGESGRPNPVHR